jgi:hypothetical protein
MTHNITIITSLVYVENNTHFSQMPEIINHLSKLLETNIPIYIFVEPKYYSIIKNVVINIPHHATFVKLEKIPFSLTWVHHKCYERMELQMPQNRNPEKDTKDFILSGHTKHQFIKEVAEKNPFQTTHFMWMDMDIPKIFHTKNETLQYLRELSRHYLAPSFITFPGCWPKLEKSKIRDVLDSVHWRFCGGFILGDKESMFSFCNLYEECIIQFWNTYNSLVWDFNVWAWMEIEYEDRWSPSWYKADHNDSIVFISGDNTTRSLKTEHCVVYDYPTIETYYPTSACYLFYNNKHYLNTRYVNYWIYPSGSYLFANGTRLIENKNMLSELDGETMKPVYYKEIEEHIEMPVNREGISIGLEDIRLYEYEGGVKYIATTLGYSQCGKSRMIVGNYDIENARICDGTIIHPPQDTWCEKNWIPFVKKSRVDDNTLELNVADVEEELFIYKWYPLEFGKIETINNIHTLKIVESHEAPSLIFSKIRGSSIFQETEEGYMGVVHYSEEHSPRHYYHMMVILDRETLCIKNYSQTFCFEKLGIEFCIGFKYTENNILFWISKHDRDPILVYVQKEHIKWIL